MNRRMLLTSLGIALGLGLAVLPGRFLRAEDGCFPFEIDWRAAPADLRARLGPPEKTIGPTGGPAEPEAKPAPGEAAALYYSATIQGLRWELAHYFNGGAYETAVCSATPPETTDRDREALVEAVTKSLNCLFDRNAREQDLEEDGRKTIMIRTWLDDDTFAVLQSPFGTHPGLAVLFLNRRAESTRPVIEFYDLNYAILQENRERAARPLDTDGGEGGLE